MCEFFCYYRVCEYNDRLCFYMDSMCFNMDLVYLCVLIFRYLFVDGSTAFSVDFSCMFVFV